MAGEKDIPGWVWLFFVWTIINVVGTPIVAVQNQINVFNRYGFPYSMILAALQVVAFVLFTAFAFYTLYALYKFKSNARNTAKLFIVLNIIFIAAFLLIMFATGSLEGASYIVGVFVLLAWYRYFNSSKNLAKVYPETKGTNAEKLLFVSSLVLWLALMGLAFYTAATVIPEEPLSYQQCLYSYEKEECSQMFYDWCVAATDDSALVGMSLEDFCTEYKNCLDLYEDDAYCDTQFFEEVS